MAVLTKRPARSGLVRRVRAARASGWTRTCLTVTMIIFAQALVLGTGFGGPRFTMLFSNVLLCAAPLAAAVACLIRAASSRGRMRAGWALVGLGVLSWGLGQGYWVWRESIQGAEVPLPSFADLGYLGLLPLAAAGLVLLPVAFRSLANRIRSVLDGLMVAVALLLVAWMLVVKAMVAAGADSTLALAVGLAYPIGDVVLMTIVAYMLAMQRQQGQHLLHLILVGVGLAAFALSDIGYAYLNLVGVYVTGTLTDSGWFAGFLLVLLAARAPQDRSPDAELPIPAAGPADRRAFGVLLPYVVVLAGLSGSIAWYAYTGQSDAFVSWSRSVLIVLIIGRQLLTMLENRGLTRDLESRVDARTAELYAREQRFHALVQHSTDVVTVVSPQSMVLYQSDSLFRVFGYPAAQVTGHRLLRLFDAESAARLAAALTLVLRSPQASTALELTVPHRDGRPRLAEMIVTNLLDDPNVGGIVLNTRDISEREALQKQLVHGAYHDALTQLANRPLFRDRTQQALTARRPDHDVTVLFLDLDGFKEINDSLGHLAGDELLVQVADRLRASVRPGDLVARFGGDEFAVLVESAVGAPVGDSDAELVAQQIVDGLCAPFRVHTRDLYVCASIGLASAAASGLIAPVHQAAPGHQSTPGHQPAEDAAEQLMRNADLAMYRAKAAGGGSFADYDPQMLSGLVDRLELESDLRGAVHRGELELHYLPTIDLRDNRIVGVEALLRWQHPTRGLLGALDFVPLAEATDLIVPLGRWVLTEACRQALAWAGPQARQRFTMAVNLSARQFDRCDLPALLGEVLAETGLPADRLCLEMTEDVLMTDTEENLSQLVRLKALGVTLAIDDFGTGFSSLAYLRRFPVDYLKIDRSFVRRLGEQTDDATLANTIVQLGHSLGMLVIAEGIEEYGQLAALRAMDCDLAQGFYFSHPLPAADIGRLALGTTLTGAN